ncbi:hypothetical protein HMPREF9946_00090 [Acetobacteraceae bacterium AT-5844]|nr:hypothetical protein HMPREF9946_00090 [Acetobacteraceae bacterium AT-5844]
MYSAPAGGEVPIRVSEVEAVLRASRHGVRDHWADPSLSGLNRR